MSKINNKTSIFQQLKELQGEPNELAAFAAAVLNENPNQQELIAVLQTLAENPHPQARLRLGELFDEYSSSGQVMDPGGQIRYWIIRALQPIAKPVDTPLFEKAALTYEYLPPQFREEAGPLRMAGVTALADLDEELAALHASRLLVEKSSDPMSGEPSVTAARLLATLGHSVSLYQYLYQDPNETLPEVLSECLHLLTTISTSLVPSLIARFSTSDNDLVLAGLFDLLISHYEGLQGEEFLISFLEKSKRYDAYRYLIALIIAERREDLLPTLLPILRFERDKEKVFILLDAFEPLKHDPEISKVVEQLRQVVRK
jgi:hypothetical protein